MTAVNVTHEPVLAENRRQFFGRSAGFGLGGLALASLLNDGPLFAAPEMPKAEPLQAKPGHYPARAKAVIHLFMAGGPSQLELFDSKPKLKELHGKPIPESFLKGKRFAFLKGVPTLLEPQRKFARHGKSGTELSELLPHLAEVIDDVAVVRSMATDVFNHGPAKVFFNTGSAQFGRPSMGAWVTYGIGSEGRDLPGFIVLQSGPRGPRGGSANWGSGFLPTTYQGVPFLPTGDPLVNLSSPTGESPDRQKRFFEGVRELNETRQADIGDPEIQTRIAAYEMAYRMQASAPALMDLSGESKETLALYGADPAIPSFARNCLLARRLIERGTRFVQLYHTDWDHHGTAESASLDKLKDRCSETDRPAAALVKDLKRLGLLDSTVVIWGGEFGRTPMGEPQKLPGRDHHIDAYSMWMAGGGVKPGITIGRTDEIGFGSVEDRVHVHDLQATILRLLGLDHTKLTFKFQGRNFRLTDVHGNVVKKLLA